ncbi:MAG: hypothetical protein IPI35_20925 [Deltaproteobacteria bacterium]|nr:hypothetical protein [Deltaproteobacteria bacterium]
MFASVVGYLTIDPVFTAMGADATTLPMIRQYMGPWYLSIVLLVVPMMGNAALRDSGDSMTQARTMIISAILNGILDPILIFGHGGHRGHGRDRRRRGGIIACGVAAALTLWVLIRGADLVSFERVPFAEVKASWRQILKVGAPPPTSLALLRTTVLALPLAWIGAQWNGLEGLFIGVAAANIITGLAAFWMARPLRAGILPDPGAR